MQSQQNNVLDDHLRRLTSEERLRLATALAESGKFATCSASSGASNLKHRRPKPIAPTQTLAPQAPLPPVSVKPDKSKKEEKEKPKEEEVTVTVIQAFPTKYFSDAVLQSLLPSDWWSSSVSQFNSRDAAPLRRPVNIFHPFFLSLNQALQGQIFCIEMVENPYLWLMYQLKAVETVPFFNSTEVLLFHGTKTSNLHNIFNDNFNYRLAGTSVGHRHGRGVNFSSNPQFCVRFAQRGCIVVARVLRGVTSPGSADTLLPAPFCDSTGNFAGDIIVKYHDHEFYPEFLVHLKA
ncbi:uncharacterized protein LOC132202743 [Neocloeon triangulifer]|uniref:uncharacterized protein LOC132202743 n=1 Tax=Neocloeon triangulifer TaxID=2078957 RepID=UPI00286F638D|nr:uncharacterized protein LOC132202743 [Neocloeon triangulifer]